MLLTTTRGDDCFHSSQDWIFSSLPLFMPSPNLVQDTIRSCAQKDGCDSANKIPEIRARVAELVKEGLAQRRPSFADTGYWSVSSGVPTDGVVGDETLDQLLLWTGGDGAEMQGDSGVARECYGGLDAEQRAEGVEEASCPLNAARQGKIEERGEGGHAQGEVPYFGINRGEYAPEHGGACCEADGWGVSAGTESIARGLEEKKEAGNFWAKSDGRNEKDGLSIGYLLPSDTGGTSDDAEASAVVVALSGWEVDDIEALLQVRRRKTGCSLRLTSMSFVFGFLVRVESSPSRCIVFFNNGIHVHLRA